MKDWSRRSVLRATAGVAIAVPMAALTTGAANTAARADAGVGGTDRIPNPIAQAGPVMFCVHDASTGQVSILHGTSEVIVTDRQLVARILSAAATI